MPTDHARFSDVMYEQLARIGKALAAPKRLELLDLLGQGPRTVESLATHGRLSVANASQHLQVLRSAGLVEGERRGTFVEYRLADAGVARLSVALRDLARDRLAEVDRLARAHLGPPDADDEKELVRQVRAGEVAVLDVRPAEEHAAGHLPRAIGVPLTELKARVGELPRDRPLVVHGRGPFCGLAADAVALLRKAGVDARRLGLGVADWRARGGWVETPRPARAR